MNITRSMEPRMMTRVTAWRWNVKQTSRFALFPPFLFKHKHSLTHTAKSQPRLSEATLAGSRLDGPEDVGKEF